MGHAQEKLKEFNMKKVKKYKISFRLKVPLFEKCQTQKFALREGRKPQSRKRQPSEYGKQLLEKQKIRYVYSLNERHLKNYVKKALESDDHEKALINLLERRLDSIVHRLGLGDTRRMCRQLVSHGHITVNGRKTTIPSRQIFDADVIGLREASKNIKPFELIEKGKKIKKDVWVNWNSNDRTGQTSGDPTLEDNIFDLPTVFEYYSR